jgi:hypothetical protein
LSFRQPPTDYAIDVALSPLIRHDLPLLMIAADIFSFRRHISRHADFATPLLSTLFRRHFRYFRFAATPAFRRLLPPPHCHFDAAIIFAIAFIIAISLRLLTLLILTPDAISRQPPHCR